MALHPPVKMFSGMIKENSEGHKMMEDHEYLDRYRMDSQKFDFNVFSLRQFHGSGKFSLNLALHVSFRIAFGCHISITITINSSPSPLTYHMACTSDPQNFQDTIIYLLWHKVLDFYQLGLSISGKKGTYRGWIMFPQRNTSGIIGDVQDYHSF